MATFLDHCPFSARLDSSVTIRAAAIVLLSSRHQDAGAVGVAVRCDNGASAGDALTTLLEESASAQLECLVIAGAEDVVAIAEAGGAAAVACAFDGATFEATGDAVRLGAWDGDDDALVAARETGCTKFILMDGCGGELAPPNVAWCEGRVRSFRTQKSSQWGGSMFASTNGDVAPPGVRNPRMWAQSQRQAREIMYESAKSRDLPPPKLSRNTVL